MAEGHCIAVLLLHCLSGASRTIAAPLPPTGESCPSNGVDSFGEPQVPDDVTQFFKRLKDVRKQSFMEREALEEEYEDFENQLPEIGQELKSSDFTELVDTGRTEFYRELAAVGEVISTIEDLERTINILLSWRVIRKENSRLEYSYKLLKQLQQKYMDPKHEIDPCTDPACKEIVKEEEVKLQILGRIKWAFIEIENILITANLPSFAREIYCTIGMDSLSDIEAIRPKRIQSAPVSLDEDRLAAISKLKDAHAKTISETKENILKQAGETLRANANNPPSLDRLKEYIRR